MVSPEAGVLEKIGGEHELPSSKRASGEEQTSENKKEMPKQPPFLFHNAQSLEALTRKHNVSLSLSVRLELIEIETELHLFVLFMLSFSSRSPSCESCRFSTQSEALQDRFLISYQSSAGCGTTSSRT